MVESISTVGTSTVARTNRYATKATCIWVARTAAMVAAPAAFAAAPTRWRKPQATAEPIATVQAFVTSVPENPAVEVVKVYASAATNVPAKVRTTPVFGTAYWPAPDGMRIE